MVSVQDSSGSGNIARTAISVFRCESGRAPPCLLLHRLPSAPAQSLFILECFLQLLAQMLFFLIAFRNFALLVLRRPVRLGIRRPDVELAFESEMEKTREDFGMDGILSILDHFVE